MQVFFQQIDSCGWNSVLLINSHYTTMIKLENFDVSTSFRGLHKEVERTSFRGLHKEVETSKVSSFILICNVNLFSIT